MEESENAALFPCVRKFDICWKPDVEKFLHMSSGLFNYLNGGNGSTNTTLFVNSLRTSCKSIRTFFPHEELALS